MTTSSPNDVSFGMAGAVLVGGSSTRMRADKARLSIHGRPMLDVVASALRGAGATPVLAIGRPLAQSTASDVDEWVSDRSPGQGPLGGILTALSATDAPWVAVLACDLPAASADEIARLADAVGDADVAITAVAGRRQYLHALWSRRAEIHLAACFESGERSIHRALVDMTVVEVEATDPPALSDVDTPEDLRAFLDGR